MWPTDEHKLISWMKVKASKPWKNFPSHIQGAEALLARCEAKSFAHVSLNVWRNFASLHLTFCWNLSSLCRLIKKLRHRFTMKLETNKIWCGRENANEMRLEMRDFAVIWNDVWRSFQQTSVWQRGERLESWRRFSHHSRYTGTASFHDACSNRW